MREVFCEDVEMNPTLKRWIYRYGMAMMFASYFVMLITFMMAYFNNYQTTVLINAYGEAQVEFIMFVTAFPCVLYTFSKMRSEHKKWH